MPDNNVVEIARIGAKGDGCADVSAQQVFVPYALPGEGWRQHNGEWQRLSDSPDRVEPVCQHFGTCGGCVAQHMSTQLYEAWKLEAVRLSFAHQGISVEPEFADAFPIASRRRCALTAKKTRSGVVLGFLEARSHTVVDLAVCPVLVPEIANKFGALRKLADLSSKAGGTLRIDVLSTRSGLDVSVGGDVLDLSQQMRVELAGLASQVGFARLIVGNSEIAQLQVPIVNCSGVDVAIHPHAFLQAVEAAEVELASLVVRHCGRSKNVGDLFCGIGTFAFALARGAKVVAIDSDRSSIETLCAARDQAQKLKPIETLVRDLFHEPLSRKELEDFDCVVFDPPRAGAEGQARMLAKSRVPKVIAVSCNPATLARDVKHLLDGGYQLDALNCVDQFRFSAHIECVASLTRPRSHRARR